MNDFLLLLAFFFQSPQSYALSGTVVDCVGGQKLPNATVTISSAESPSEVKQVTASDGSFRFTELNGGFYRLSAEHAGYMKQDFHQKSLHRTLHTNIVLGPAISASQDPAPPSPSEPYLNFCMIPSASLQGKVTDSLGHPLAPVGVQAVRVNDDGPIRRTIRSVLAITDALGEYSIPNLEEGRWIIVTGGPHLPNRDFTIPPLTDAYPVTFYPGTTNLADAQAILLKPGQVRQADVVLRGVPESNVEIHLIGGIVGERLLAAIAWPGFDNHYLSMGMQGPLAGDVTTLSNVAVGSQVILLGDLTNHVVARAPIDVVDENVSVNIRRTAAHVVVDLLLTGFPDNETPDAVTLTSVELGRTLSRSFSGMNRADFGSVLAGSYSIEIFGSQNYAITFLDANGTIVKGNTFTVPESGDLNLQIVATPGISVDGVVTRNGKPTEGVVALLVPRGDTTQHGLYRTDQTANDGSFEWQGVVPGDYWMLLGEDWDTETFRHADLPADLLKKAQPLTVREDSSPQTVRLEYKP